MKITQQILFAHKVEHANLCAFQDRIERFGDVVVGITTTGTLLITMINPIVSGKHFAGLAVAVKLIVHQMLPLINKAFDMWKRVFETITFNRNRPNWVVSLCGNPCSLHFHFSASFMFNSILIQRLASNVIFSQSTVQNWDHMRTRINHLSNRMAKLPGVFLENSDPFGQKRRGYPLAGVGDVVHSQLRFPERQLGAVRRRSRCKGKLPFAKGTFRCSGSQALFRESIGF